MPRINDSVVEESVLVVDDEPLLCSMLSRFLRLKGYQVQTANGGEEALDKVLKDEPRLIILDLYMPNLDGLTVLRLLRDFGYQGTVLALTACRDEQLLKEVMRLGVFDVIGKPVNLNLLDTAIRAGLVMS